MPDVAGGGHIGIALEATHGTYQAPTKYVPVESESLAEVRNDPYRMPMLGRAVVSGKVKGRESVAGTIQMEAVPEIALYFLIASRWGNNIIKSGAGPFTYTANDDAAAHVKANNRSLTIVADRGGVGFAYLGCQVTSMRWFLEDGIPKVEYQIVGREQTESYTPGSPTDPTETPFGADNVTAEIATVSRTDVDSVEVSLDDNGEARFNVDGNERASYVRFGEFVGEASFEVDFENKADYALWVARTSQEFIMRMGASPKSIVVELHGALYDAFDVGLSGLGDQVRASATLRASYVGAGDTAAAEIVMITNEDVTL